MANATSTASPSSGHELSRSLASRHVTMITIDGVIGAALFVGSSAASQFFISLLALVLTTAAYVLLRKGK